MVGWVGGGGGVGGRCQRWSGSGDAKGKGGGGVVRMAVGGGI